MKNILCYGDSNTWGAIPGDYHRRFEYEQRWTGVLQNQLGPQYRVIEEGLSGRTTVLEDSMEDGRNGKTWLLPCLRSHRPLDLVVLMLGTNDLKSRFNFSAFDVSKMAGLLVNIIRQSACGINDQAPLVLLVAPPPLGPLGSYAAEFSGGTAKSLELAAQFQQRAVEQGCLFLDAGSVIKSSSGDGVHFDAPEHQKLGLAIAALIHKTLE
ncbi:MAG: SGNH/GDSL hydrolase family protein [Anaerolineae bacterium]|nr:SGNH/GDSL hydrolase family protein [Anaerolineae bacterium]